MKTGVKVLDAMTKEPVVVDPEITLEKCAKLMLKHGVGGVVVKDGSILQGIVTEKDFVEKVVAKGLNPKKSRVKDVMKKRVVSIEPDKDIHDAIIKMRDSDVRRLPVVHDGMLVGLLTEKDILKIEPSLFELLVEKFRLREEAGKPVFLKGLKTGSCESCGSFGKLRRKGDRLICEGCSGLE